MIIPERKESLIKLKVVIGACVLIIGAGLYSVIRVNEKEIQPSQVFLRDIESQLPVVCDIASQNVKSVISLVDATVESIEVKSGEFVKVGQSLLSLQNKQTESAYLTAVEDYELELQNNLIKILEQENLLTEKKYNLEILKLEYATTQKELEAKNVLIEKKIISTLELDVQKNKLKKIEKEIEAAELTLKRKAKYIQALKRLNEITLSKLNRNLLNSKAQYESLNVVAPIEGYVEVSVTNLIEGSNIKSREELIKIYSNNVLLMTLKIPVKHVNDVFAGTKVVLVVSDNQTTASEVSRVDSSVKNGYFTAEATVPESSRTFLRPGMSKRCNITLESAVNVIAIPYKSVMQSNSSGKIDILDENLSIKERADIRLGIHDGEFIQVKRGLSNGDIIDLNSFRRDDEGM